MISLLGSLLGFVTATGPSIFKQFMDAKQDARDKEHELKIMAQQSQDRRDSALIERVGEAAFDLISLELFQLLWSNEVVSIFSVIISFWFGQRLVSKWAK